MRTFAAGREVNIPPIMTVMWISAPYDRVWMCLRTVPSSNKSPPGKISLCLPEERSSFIPTVTFWTLREPGEADREHADCQEAS